MTYGSDGDAIASWLEGVLDEQRDEFPKTRNGKRKRAARDPVRLRQLSVEDLELPETLRTIVQDLSLLSKSRSVIHQGLR